MGGGGEWRGGGMEGEGRKRGKLMNNLYFNFRGLDSLRTRSFLFVVSLLLLFLDLLHVFFSRSSSGPAVLFLSRRGLSRRGTCRHPPRESAVPECPTCRHPRRDYAEPQSLPPRLLVQFVERYFRDEVVGYALLEVLGEPRGLLDLPLVPVRERPILHFVLDLPPEVDVLPEDEGPTRVVAFLEEDRHRLLTARPCRVECGPVRSLDLEEEEERGEQPRSEKSAEDGVDRGVVQFEGGGGSRSVVVRATSSARVVRAVQGGGDPAPCLAENDVDAEI